MQLVFRVEFQQRGWPHIHCLFWTDAPKIQDDTDNRDVADFIDRYVTCNIDPDMDEQLNKKLL